jgi:hypothetical protein
MNVSKKKSTSRRRKSPLKKSTSRRRKSPVKKSISRRQKSPLKKSKSRRRKSPMKKSTSRRRKSPLKKSTSRRRKSPLKKSRSLLLNNKKIPSKRYHHKLHLRGGKRVKCAQCKSEKNESDTHQIFNRTTRKEETRCKKPCVPRTERQAAAENAAIAAQQEANRQEQIIQNAARLAANPELAADRLAREQAHEDAARAREEAARAREEAARAREEAIAEARKLYEENKAYKRTIIEGQKEIKQIKNRKKDLEKEVAFDPNLLNQLNQRLYRHYGETAPQKRQTEEYVQRIKELRNKYIKLWNYNNNYYDDYYDPLWNHIDDKIANYHNVDIPRNIIELITKRNAYKSYHDRNTISRIHGEHRGSKNILYEGSDVADNTILMKRILISYSSDSINKNLNTDDSEHYLFSPNSIEIHCTTVKTEDKDTDPQDARNHIIPSNFYGHVTLTVIGSINKSDEKTILTKAAIEYKHKDKNPSKTMHNCTEDIERKRNGRTFHYGIFQDKYTKLTRERWWSNNIDLVNFEREIFTHDIESTFFPTHNSPMQLMKEYYLKCINTCPEQIVFRPNYIRGQTKLTFKDLTDWGIPKQLYEPTYEY